MAQKPKIIPPYVIGSKDHPWGGLNTATKDNREMERGESYDQLNWITGRDKDNIQLRRGTKLFGNTRRIGTKVTGIGVGTRIDGIQQPFFTSGRKIFYYDRLIDDTAEVSTINILPVAANGEETSFVFYENLAGSFMYLSSPNSSLYKISVANPESVSDQLTKDYHFGYIRTDRSRMFGVNRHGSSSNSLDTTGLYVSHLDKQLVTDYTANFMSLPPAPTLTPHTTGGSIADGTYYFVVTTFGPDGVETIHGAESSTTIAGGGGLGSITITFPSVAGGTAYKIYSSTVSGVYTSPALVTSTAIIPVVGSLNTFTQTGPLLTGAPPSTSAQQIIAPIATGDGTTVTFSGTLPFVFQPITVFYVTITDGIELFLDDKSGNLVGSAGGTGTINYVTGVYSVTFAVAPVTGRIITASYYEEDSTNGGVADFTVNLTDATNSSGQIFRQDDGGGKAQAVYPYLGVEYCFHVLRSWQLTMGQATIPSSVTPATTFDQQPYYEQLGIPHPLAAFPNADGINFLNMSNPSNPVFSILQIPPGSTNLTVTPVPLSNKLDLTGFGYDSAVVFRAGDFDILSCEKTTNGITDNYNSVTFVRNIWSGLWNKLDYYINCLALYQGAVLAGDSLSSNVFELFSGFDDDGNIITNFYKNAFTDHDIDGLKKCNFLNVSGLIQNSQKIGVYISTDQGAYTKVYTILGTGPYVNSSSGHTIGSTMAGLGAVGGGSTGGTTVIANEFELDIPIHSSLYEYISFMLVAEDVGYVQVDRVEYKDIRFKRRRLLQYQDPEINQ